MIDILPMSRYLHMNRFIAWVHMGGILLMPVALAAPWRWAVSQKHTWYAVGAIALAVWVLLLVDIERRSYLAENAAAIDVTQEAAPAEDADLTGLFATLNRLPSGRVYSGQQRGSV